MTQPLKKRLHTMIDMAVKGSDVMRGHSLYAVSAPLRDASDRRVEFYEAVRAFAERRPFVGRPRFTRRSSSARQEREQESALSLFLRDLPSHSKLYICEFAILHLVHIWVSPLRPPKPFFACATDSACTKRDFLWFAMFC